MRKTDIPFRFVTNNSRMTKKFLISFLNSIGLEELVADEIFAAPHAAIEYCNLKNFKKIFLVVSDNGMREDFSEFELTEINPDDVADDMLDKELNCLIG